MEDDDDLETTMRHGLRELANDAPRGDGLWNTTTSMIAIQPGMQPPDAASPKPPPAAPEPAAPDAKPEPPAPSSRARSQLLVGILIGLGIALLLVVGILIGLSLRSDSSTTPTTTKKKAALGSWPNRAIPVDDVVYNDGGKHRVIVASRALAPVGVITPSNDSNWRAVRLSLDRTHLFLSRADGDCSELWDLDLTTHALQKAVPEADVVSLSPDTTKALLTWDAGCARVANEPEGRYALRDATDRTQTTLAELPAGTPVNVAWSPWGDRFAAEPVGSHHVYVYDSHGRLVSQLLHPPSSQDGLGWTSQGLILVDLGLDRTAVLRKYDPATGQPIGELARMPEIGSAPSTPTVTAIHESGDLTFVEEHASGDAPGELQAWVVQSGQPRPARAAWSDRELVG